MSFHLISFMSFGNVIKRVSGELILKYQQA